MTARPGRDDLMAVLEYGALTAGGHKVPLGRRVKILLGVQLPRRLARELGARVMTPPAKSVELSTQRFEPIGDNLPKHVLLAWRDVVAGGDVTPGT